MHKLISFRTGLSASIVIGLSISPCLNFDFLSLSFKTNCLAISWSFEVCVFFLYWQWYIFNSLPVIKTLIQIYRPKCRKAKGKPVYCIQLRIWQDDVSGNVSKQWNKHWMYCMTLAGIPKKLLAQEYFTHYISCSPHASVLEQASALNEAIRLESSFFASLIANRLHVLQN